FDVQHIVHSVSPGSAPANFRRSAAAWHYGIGHRWPRQGFSFIIKEPQSNVTAPVLFDYPPVEIFFPPASGA
ncbi:MAG TPA: hypothetical protein PKC18_02100, partial [Lacipirellulaceae bacterium]|nr:hypothetical protein [Lacipirellulaceae bacterium]